jgi:hypothetical protein
MTPRVPSCSRSRSLGLHVVRSAWHSDSAPRDVAWAGRLTVVDYLRLQDEALAALLCSLRIGVGSDRQYAVVGQRVPAELQLFAAACNVLGLEDSRRRCGDRLLEEAAVQHLHGAVHGRREHFVSHGTCDTTGTYTHAAVCVLVTVTVTPAQALQISFESLGDDSAKQGPRRQAWPMDKVRACY